MSKIEEKSCIDKELINNIYQRLGNDELSKDIFSNRLLHSLTGDNYFLDHIINKLPSSKKFYELLNQSKDGIVIFGAGTWGRNIYNMGGYNWKMFVDNNPRVSKIKGLTVVSYYDFVSNYRNETVVISSRLYHKDMYNQLIESGISRDKIINAGYMLDELSKQQYFDLEEFKSNEEEVFVDVGGFDGMTSIGFLDWCKNSKEKSIYVFEPDSDNIEKCHNNLSKYTDNYKIIDKGCWSTEDTLKFKAQGNGASSIDTTGENEVKVTTLDKELQDKKVTFIKMDIEGAEVEALKGAKNIIEKNKPKLAISIYHKPEDIWEIPKIIMQYCPEYRFWLRHYSLTSAETVLYAM